MAGILVFSLGREGFGASLLASSEVDKSPEKKEPITAIKEVKDPFTVDFQVSKKDGTVEASVGTVDSQTFVLQGIILSGRKSVALIDDSIVGMGDYIYGWRVVGIKKDLVGLKKEGKIKRLLLNLGG